MYERPGVELTDDLGKPILEGTVLIHDIGYLENGAEFWWLGGDGPANDMLLGQTEKFRVGAFGAHLPGRFGTFNDRWVGGGGSVFARMVHLDPARSNHWAPRTQDDPRGVVFLNPARQWAKHDTYASLVDGDGDPALRGVGFASGGQPRDVVDLAALTEARLNEVMIRNGLTLYDDVEVLMCTSALERKRDSGLAAGRRHHRNSGSTD